MRRTPRDAVPESVLKATVILIALWIVLDAAGAFAVGSDATFTAEQAASGQTTYAAQCRSCHGTNLEGGLGPALSGQSFLEHWVDGRKTADDLFYIVKNQMPLLAPRSLNDTQYINLVSFILSRNGYQGGHIRLSLSSAKNFVLRPQSRALALRKHRPDLPVLIGNFGQATTSMPDDSALARDEDSDWLVYNGSFSGQRFSGLNQIDVGNAKHLTVSCIFQTGESGASFQSSPVIYDGILYVTTPYTTFALDAASCHKRWQHEYPASNAVPVSVNRGVAIYKGKIFRATPNGHLLAIDAKTGTLLWDVWVADELHGYWISAAPIAYDGKVFIGTAGADWGANSHLYAFDVDTARGVWSFDVIPTGSEPGAETWGSGAARGGGAIWSTFSLDPAKGLVLASIGNPAPNFNGAIRPGSNLYTDSVIALDYKTGKIAWYVQQIPHDTHDWDTAAAPALYDIDGTRYLAVANKGGWVYIYNRQTRNLVAQTEVSFHENVDTPLTTEGVHHCPGILGGVQWNGTAYSPQERLLFMNTVHWCGTTRLSQDRYIEGSSYFDGDHTWDSRETTRGWTRAVNAVTGAMAWSRESRTPMLAGLTPTAGGVLFTGDLDGNFLVLDSKSGTELYRFNTGGAIAGAASTYALKGRQYVAVTSGNASRNLWGTIGSATVVVFSLPIE